jgi:hypothetical protein
MKKNTLAPVQVKKRTKKSFNFKANEKQISFKLDLENIKEKDKLEAIEALETLLEKLKLD